MTKNATKTAETKKPEAEVETAERTFDLAAAAEYYREHSAVQKNGVRVVHKDAFLKGLEERHGVTEAMVTKVHEALMDEKSAAVVVATDDAVEAVEKARKDGVDEKVIREISRTVRVPVMGGECDYTILAYDEDTKAKKGAGPIEKTINHGTIVSSINATDGIRRAVAESARVRLAKAMGA